MKTFKEIVRRILCLPLYFGTLIAFVVHLFWGEKSFWSDGIFVTQLKEKSWPQRTWYSGWGGTCFGYGIMLAFDQEDSVLIHEKVHTKQNEGGCITGFILGVICSLLTLNFIPFFVCWVLCAKLCYVSASLVALFRGEGFYKNNHMEESARSLAKEPPLK
jgi:hypothetical protein